MGLDWKTGEFVKTNVYYRRIYRDHDPEIDEVSKDVFDQKVAEIRKGLEEKPSRTIES